MSKYNDINIKKWKEYGDIFTDSLWIIDKRDNSGAHSGHYHGNFVPQIPNQLLRRYTKKGDWILDPFMGSGTTLIEANRLNRNSVGIELQKDVAKEAAKRISIEKKKGVKTFVINGDSATINYDKLMSQCNVNKFQFEIFHPPYWNIIRFSNSKRDLSNAPTLDKFIGQMGKVLDNALPKLEKNRYCAFIIADAYKNSEVIPLGFYLMALAIKRNLKLKAIVVKNFGETKGKANQQGIWRYRALNADFYIFKHEYILIFKKIK